MLRRQARVVAPIKLGPGNSPAFAPYQTAEPCIIEFGRGLDDGSQCCAGCTGDHPALQHAWDHLSPAWYAEEAAVKAAVAKQVVADDLETAALAEVDEKEADAEAAALAALAAQADAQAGAESEAETEALSACIG